MLISATSAFAQGVQVRDADTIVVNGTPVRLQGVDAPELGNSSGPDAKRWMVNFVQGKTIECNLTGERTYDRYVGVCFSDEQDVSAAVISAGHALDFIRRSQFRLPPER